MKKICVVLFVSILSITRTYSQDTLKPDRVCIGIIQHMGVTIPYVQKSEWNKPYINFNDSLTDITAHGKGGGGIGLIFDISISKRLSLRTGINFLIRKFNLYYHRTDGFTDRTEVDMSYAFFPISLRYNVIHRPNTRIPVGLGARFIANVTADLKDKPNDVALDFSIGIERKLNRQCERSAFYGMEVSYSHGFKDIIVSRFNMYNLTISKLTLGSLLFSVYFRL